MVDGVKDRLLEVQKPNDSDELTKVYNNLKMKANIMTETIEWVDKTLIQVRCSMEDVADNMISQMKARGEKDMKITYEVTNTLKKTGASASVVSATIMPPLRDMTGKADTELTKLIGRNLKEVDYSKDDVKGAVTEMITKIMEEDPSMHAEAAAAFESCFKDLGESFTDIQALIKNTLPPPPTPPEEIERRLQMAAELEKLEREEENKERAKQGLPSIEEEEAAKEAAEAAAADAAIAAEEANKPKNKNLDGALNGGSRRGSLEPPAPRSRQGSITIGGLERRGSYYDEDVTKRATVAVVTDDPDHKDQLKKSLSAVFNGDGTPGEGDEDGGTAFSGGGISQEEKDKIIKALPVGVSDETRALMEQILNSCASQDEINNRVAALLAGTALSTSREEPDRKQSKADGISGIENGDIGKGKVGDVAGDEGYQIPGVTMRGIKGNRTSIKRQSEILRDSRKKAQEREEERQRKKSYYRQVAGLKKAKVPLMVYSCGGFSRCFRLANFYDCEGPPVGVLYNRPEDYADARRSLNPDLSI